MATDLQNGSSTLAHHEFDPVDLRRVCTVFQLEADSITRIGSYDDANFIVETGGEKRAILKLAAGPDAKQLIEAETRLLDHLRDAAPDLAIPRVIRAKGGLPLAPYNDSEPAVIARAQSFLQGRMWVDFRPHSSALRKDLGRSLGLLTRGLETFNHTAYRRQHEWSLETLPLLRSHLDKIVDVNERRCVTAFLDAYEGFVQPLLPTLRRSVIHGDINDNNLLVATRPDGEAYISGIVDFGDALHSVTIADLAIACTYSALGVDDPLGAAAQVVSAYHQIVALEPLEIEVLFSLIRGRLAMSALHAARWRHEHGESDYHLASQDAVRKAINLLAIVDDDFANHSFRHACGLDASPASAGVSAHLSTADTAPVLSPELDIAKSIVFDLSAASPDPGVPEQRNDASHWSQTLFNRITGAGADVGIGRYDEPRICYSSDQFLTPAGEQRTIHLGIDLFAAAGTSVHAPLDGRVHSFRDNDLELDYGPTIILEHRIAEEDVRFYTLYGHLSRSSLENLSAGQPVRKGDRIGAIGIIGENGGWPPHLHFQVLNHLYGNEGNFPGVAPPSSRSFWTNVCPDPNQILKIPESAFPAQAMGGDEILATRSRVLSPNLSLSYPEPLHIVRGFGQYLYDAEGRQYVDCVNNVAHVGHCHPKVVEAASRQMAVLNTNTRYLHENIVRYAERLTSTMPGDLRVCFFVNSGSEANDLALRLARAHTGAEDLLVLGSAYHGHLSSLIDISPYKAERKGGEGLPGYVHRLATPDVFRGPYNDPATAGKNYADEVASVVAHLQGHDRQPAAFVAESVMGCAGQIFPPDRYLALAYDHVRSAGGVCIADEVQIGFGRIGTHFWGFEQQNVIPDIVTLGKPIGNGHPLGAVVTTPEIAASFDTGMEYFNTFGGNPVSCAVGLAVLDVIEDEGLQDHARSVGSKLLEELKQIKKDRPLISDVRGSGLFIGIELVRGKAKEPATAEANYLVDRMKQSNILLSTDGPFENVIKFKPPMVFSSFDAERLIDVLHEVMRDDFLSLQDL